MWGTGLRLFADLPTIPNCKEKYKTLWLQQTSEYYPAQWQLQRVHLCRRHEINSLDVPRLYCMTEHFAETSQMPDMKEHNHFWLSIWPLIIFPLAHYFCVLFTCTLQPCTELPWVKWVQVLEVAQCSVWMWGLCFGRLISGDGARKGNCFRFPTTKDSESIES